MPTDAWAERAAQAGYPLRYAQVALGHASTAVHVGYSRQATVVFPSLEEYEAAGKNQNVIPFRFTEAEPIQDATVI